MSGQYHYSQLINTSDETPSRQINEIYGKKFICKICNQTLFGAQVWNTHEDVCTENQGLKEKIKILKGENRDLKNGNYELTERNQKLNLILTGF